MADQPRDIPDENLKRWLEQTREDVIDPDQPIIDPHHHLWDRRSQPELAPGSRQHRVYLEDELIGDIRGAGHNVIDTVFVECRYKYRRGGGLDAPVGETEFVQDFSARLASRGVRCCGAIVGFTNLTLGAQAKDVLLAHQAAGRNFRGIRHAHGWHESPDMPQSHHPTAGTQGLLGLPAFREGFASLDELGLTFDCWGYQSQLEEVADLANAFPGVTIVLNHIGGPIALGPYEGQREGRVFEEWKRGIDTVSLCPNIVVKTGGCGMVNYGFGYENWDVPADSATLAELWRPYFTHLIDCFGASRCMFESNFPVDKISFSYGNMWNAFKRVSNDLGLSRDEKDDLFYRTAARSYSMDVSQTG
ncbi:MAG: amidohydrolase family protein [Gammaproteobacteria bacterium]|nr:amidohydrolase family protein [Gammaproteobacteria bacterium]